MSTPQILIVEPDAQVARRLGHIVERLGYRALTVVDPLQALDTASQTRLDLFVLGDADALQTLALAQDLRRQFERPLLLIAKRLDPALIEHYKALAPEGVLQEPVHDLTLELAIELALQRSRHDQQRRAASAALGESEEQFRGIFASAADGVIISDQTGVILMANPRCEAMLGYEPGELLGQSIEVMLPERLRAMHRQMRERYAPSPQPRSMGRGLNIIARRKDGSEFAADVSLSTLQTQHGLLVTSMLQDISAKVMAEEQLKRANRMLRVLSAGNEALVRATSETGLLESVCRAIVEVGGYPLVWVGYGSGTDALRLAMQVGELGVLDRCAPYWESERCVVNQVLRGGEPVIMRSSQAQGARCETVERHGFLAGAALPLKRAGETFGVLCILSRQDGAFNADEIKLLTELAEDLGYGIAGQRSEVVRRQAEARLRLFEQAIESSANGIMISDCSLPDKPITYVNPAFERITGYASVTVLGRNARFLVGQDTDQLPLEELRAALRQAREARVELRNYRPDGSQFWNELSVAPVRQEDGTVSHFVGVINDISERVRYEAQLERHATHDALTGLANRSLLFDRVRQAMFYAERGERSVAVLLLDLDRFKDINDTLGHGVGDQVLLEAAARIQSCVRDRDTVARLGGDEFVVVLADMAQGEDVAGLARKVLATLAQPLTVSTGAEVYLGASAGIALFPSDGHSPEALLKNADAAMYRAKEHGGGTASFYAPEMEARANRRLRLESMLRRALERNELSLHYQPQVDLDSGCIAGAEALLRWHTSEGESISPAEFIPVAEKSGLIVPIGRWVIASAVRQQRQWLDIGMPMVPVAVNLSARQFREADLVEGIVAELAAQGLEHRWLELEITESLMLENTERVLDMLQSLKSHGLNVALDDFGTGYSSLSYLQRLPIGTVKIDRAFVSDVSSNPEGAAIIPAIIGMAHSLGLKVIAEGVETAAQLHYLRAHRCDSIQGFLFSRPLPAHDFAILLRERTCLP